MAKMRIVIDTNVIAYYLLGVEPYNTEVADLFNKNIELIAPESWKPEIMNVLWLAIKNKGISLEQGIERLSLAEVLISESIPIDSLWNEALVFAVRKDHSPYDTVFIVLAEREGTKMVTYDQKVLELFPEITLRPGMVQ